MNTNIESLYKAIATECAAQQPEQWIKCILEYQSIERYAFSELSFFITPKKKKYVDFDNSVLDSLESLRTEMAKINGGEAWYTAVFRLMPDGKYKFDFDYDSLPAFDIVPSPDKWIDEFKKYPRPELQAQIQDWLDSPYTYEMAEEIKQRLIDLQRAK